MSDGAATGRGWFGELADELLDKSLLGYTRYGFRWRGLKSASGSLADKHILVTGATSGLGAAAAYGFASAGARLTLLGRNADKLREQSATLETFGKKIVCVQADLAHLNEVEQVATRLAAQPDPIDCVVLNAGVLEEQAGRDDRGLTLAYRVNVLAQHLLLCRLRGKLNASPSGRAILVSSGGMFSERLDVSYLVSGGQGRYDGVRHYAQTKRAQAVIANAWQANYGDRFRCFVMHPGWADTPGVERSLPRFYRWTKPLLRSAEQGADTVVWLASAELAEQPHCIWHDRKPRSLWRLSRTRECAEERQRLFATLHRHIDEVVAAS